MARGIISPPRGRHSYKPSGSRIRPQCPRTTTAVNPNEHRSDRKETQSTAVKPNAIRATKNNDDRSSNTSRIDPLKSTSKAVSSRRPIATPNPNEKKLDNNNSTPKTATVVLLVTILMVVISYSGGLYGTPSDDPDGRNQLQQLSIHGKDLANIALHANSIYKSVGSDTKKEGSSQSNNAPRIFQIYKEIASHRQGNSSITSYFTKLKALWDELATYIDVPQCSCGSIEKLSEHIEREKVLQFLVGLNDSYSTICAQILLVKAFPTVEKAYSVIIQEEKRREPVLSPEIVAAKVIQNNWLLHKGHSNNNGDNDGIEEIDNDIHEQHIDQNEVTGFPIEELLIDLGSPVRC